MNSDEEHESMANDDDCCRDLVHCMFILLSLSNTVGSYWLPQSLYLSIKLAWKALIPEQNSSKSSGWGKNVLRKWAVPST